MSPTNNSWYEYPIVHFQDTQTNYTISQLEELLIDTGNTVPASIYSNVKNYIQDLQPPQVPTSCFGGSGNYFKNVVKN
jgi:hypothetical protein